MVKSNVINTTDFNLSIFFKDNYYIDSCIMSAFKKCVTDLINYRLVYSNDYLSSLELHLQEGLNQFQQSLKQNVNNISLILKKTSNSNNFIIFNSIKDQNNYDINKNLFVCKINLYNADKNTFLKDFSTLKEIKEFYDVQRGYYLVFLDKLVDLPLSNLIVNRFYYGYRVFIVKKQFQWINGYLRLCVYSIIDNCIQNVIFYPKSIVKYTIPAIV